jgi:oligoendopeptidase F
VREDKEFVNKVKDFLRAGSSKSVKEIFLDMGVDISEKDFWKEGIKAIRDSNI